MAFNIIDIVMAGLVIPILGILFGFGLITIYTLLTT